MRNLDKPRHGWEGISNGGEIYGSNHNSSRNNTELGADMAKKAQEIIKMLESIQLHDEDKNDNTIENKSNDEVKNTNLSGMAYHLEKGDTLSNKDDINNKLKSMQSGQSIDAKTSEDILRKEQENKIDEIMEQLKSASEKLDDSFHK